MNNVGDNQSVQQQPGQDGGYGGTIGATAQHLTNLNKTGGRRRKGSRRRYGVRKSTFRRKRRGSRRNCSSRKRNLVSW